MKDSTKEKAKGLAHSLKAAISDRWFHDITDRLDGLLSEIKTRFKDEDDHVIFRQLPEARPMTMSLTEALSQSVFGNGYQRKTGSFSVN